MIDLGELVRQGTMERLGLGDRNKDAKTAWLDRIRGGVSGDVLPPAPPNVTVHDASMVARACGFQFLGRTDGVTLVALDPDGRCKGHEIPFHDHMRQSWSAFAFGTTRIGRQESVGMVLEVGLCRGCHTTVCYLVSDDGGADE